MLKIMHTFLIYVHVRREIIFSTYIFKFIGFEFISFKLIHYFFYQFNYGNSIVTIFYLQIHIIFYYYQLEIPSIKYLWLP